jgi:excisionase family DNA binding protein
MEILNVKEIAKYLKLSTKKVYQLVQAGDIPFKRIGGQYRFIKSEIDKWVTGASVSAAEVREDGADYSSGSVKPDAELKVLLAQAAEITDNLKKNLFITAVLTRELASYKLKPVIVGGFAVEFYTMGGYNTGDVDLVFSDTALLNEVLSRMGFIKEARHWINRKLDIFIEAPGSQLSKAESEHMAEVEIQGLKVYVLGVEDLIIDRLNAYVHRNSADEANWIKELMLINYGKIDWQYLAARAKEEKTEEACLKLKQETEDAKNKL